MTVSCVQDFRQETDNARTVGPFADIPSFAYRGPTFRKLVGRTGPVRDSAVDRDNAAMDAHSTAAVQAGSAV